MGMTMFNQFAHVKQEIQIRPSIFPRFSIISEITEFSVKPKFSLYQAIQTFEARVIIKISAHERLRQLDIAKVVFDVIAIREYFLRRKL